MSDEKHVLPCFPDSASHIICCKLAHFAAPSCSFTETPAASESLLLLLSALGSAPCACSVCDHVIYAQLASQAEALKMNKPLMVVGTPGRLTELSRMGRLQIHNCHTLVLDEVSCCFQCSRCNPNSTPLHAGSCCLVCPSAQMPRQSAC